VLDFEVLALDQKGRRAISQRVFSVQQLLLRIDPGTCDREGDRRVIAATRVRSATSRIGDISSPIDERRKRIVAFPDSLQRQVRGRIVYTARRPEFPGEFAATGTSPDQPPE